MEWSTLISIASVNLTILSVWNSRIKARSIENTASHQRFAGIRVFRDPTTRSEPCTQSRPSVSRPGRTVASGVDTRERKTNGKHTSAGFETLILQSHPGGVHSNSNSELIHDILAKRLPSSSGDLLRSPGWSFKFSLIS